MTGRQRKGPSRRKLKRLARRAEVRKAAQPGRWGTLLVRHKAVIHAVLIFAGLLLLALFAYDWLTNSDFFHPVLALTAGGTGWLVNLFGGDVEVQGVNLVSKDFTMDIVGECTGLIPAIIFLCALVAYPDRPISKLVGGALGTVIMLVLNFVRTTSLFYIGSAFPGFLDVAHYLIWQSLMILAAIFLWLFWVERLSRVPQT